MQMTYRAGYVAGVTIRASVFAAVAVRVCLRCVGVQRTAQLLARLSARCALADTACPPTANLVTVSDFAQRVADVCAFFPARMLCLDQSLILWFFLRRRGLLPTFRIGVRPLPFAAHAWVELDGVPLNEDWERVRLLRPLWVYA